MTGLLNPNTHWQLLLAAGRGRGGGGNIRVAEAGGRFLWKLSPQPRYNVQYERQGQWRWKKMDVSRLGSGGTAEA